MVHVRGGKDHLGDAMEFERLLHAVLAVFLL
jgi:hypothetical protein